MRDAIIYKTNITFAHKLNPEAGLVDDKCSIMHKHTGKMKVYVHMLEENSECLEKSKFLDFKKLKEIVEDVCYVFRTYNANEILGSEHATLEKISKCVSTLCYNKLKDQDYCNVENVCVEIWETKKYGAYASWV